METTGVWGGSTALGKRFGGSIRRQLHVTALGKRFSTNGMGFQNILRYFFCTFAIFLMLKITFESIIRRSSVEINNFKNSLFV
jgi:hypothetical protein